MRLAEISGHRKESVLFCDLDGTLAPIVPDPEKASVPPKTRRVLMKAGSAINMYVLTGRSISKAEEMLGSKKINIIGVHGMEFFENGKKRFAGQALRFLSDAQHIAEQLRRRTSIFGNRVMVEDKEISSTIHFRQAPELEEKLLDIANSTAAPAGFVVEKGRKMIELLPPVPVNKGTAVRTVLLKHKARFAVYLGDDRTDLDAFIELKTMEREGIIEKGFCVWVSSSEGPKEMVEYADLIVQGPEDAARVVSKLALE